MKKELLNKIEEKIAFPISRWFWHVLIGLGLLTLFFGVLVLAYTYWPTSVAKVPEPKLPAPISISKQDLISCGKVKSAQSAQIQGPALSAPSSEIPLLAQLDSLKKEMPENQYPWETKMDTSYSTREDWSYETGVYTIQDTSVTEKPGFKEPLIQMITTQGGNDAKAQQAIADSLLKFVRWTKTIKTNYLNLAILFANNSNDSLSATELLAFLNRSADFYINGLKSSDSVLPNVGQNFLQNPSNLKSNIQLLDEVNFVARYALNEGASLGNQANQFADYNSLFRLMSQSINEFRDNAELHTADSMYFALEKSARSELLKSLPCYYQAYLNKNSSRNASIAKIKAEHQKQLKAAEADAKASEISKSLLRSTTFIVLIAALMVVAFFSLMLVLLSMQRSMKQMLEIQKQDRNLNA